MLAEEEEKIQQQNSTTHFRENMYYLLSEHEISTLFPKKL